MCGRYASTKDPATLLAEFEALDQLGGGAVEVNHNVAPTKDLPTVVQRHPRDAEGHRLDEEPAERSLRLMRWGLVPFWAKSASVGNRMINTRAESAASKPAFRKPLSRQRCLVPADGWFEWRRDEGGKQPFFMTGPDERSLAFGGIWDTWRDPAAAEDAAPLITFSIITTDSVGQLSDIHHRMPLLLPADAWADWLDPDRTDADDLAALLAPPAESLVAELELRPVSTLVNNVRNRGPELLERVEIGQSELDSAGQGALFDSPS